MPFDTKLYQVIKTLSDANLWDYFNTDEFIALQLPMNRDPVFVTLMEDENIKSIIIYRDYADLSYVYELNRYFDNEPDSYFYTQSCIVIFFENREDIDPESYRRIKESTITFRGKKRWPEIIDFKPDYEPELLYKYDEEWVFYVLDAFLETVKYYTEKDISNTNAINQGFIELGREYFIDGTFKNKSFSIPDFVRSGVTEQTYGVLPVLITKFELLRAKNLPQNTNIWELKAERIEDLTKDDFEERAFHPTAYALVDSILQEVIDIALFKPEEDEIVQRGIFRIILNHGYRPGAIYIQSEYYNRVVAILGELFKALEIEVKKVDYLPATTNIERTIELSSLFEIFLKD